jgi:hypothetical protein
VPNTHLHADDRPGLERLCWFGARGALALERMARTEDGRVSYRMKRPLPDGTLHLVLPPVEFLRRVAALVPPPGSNLMRFHGVFAPGSALRPQVVPKAETPAPVSGEPPGGAAVAKRKRAPRLDWAQLLQRTFDVDVFAGGRCGGRLKGVGGAQGGGDARHPAAPGAAGRAAPGGALARAARRGMAALRACLGRVQPRQPAPRARRGCGALPEQALSHGTRPVATPRQQASRAAQGAAQGESVRSRARGGALAADGALCSWAVVARTQEG